MAAPPTPTREFLASQVRWAMGRGLPAQVAEDVVFEAFEAAAASFDPRRGSFEAYMQKVVRNACAYWWRGQGRTERAHTGLRLVASPHETARLERAARHQAEILEALDDEEREVFAAWALQKHLGKGQVTSADVGRSLGLQPSEFDNAKRRLRSKLQRLLTQLGWSVATLLHGEDDVDRTG